MAVLSRIRALFSHRWAAFFLPIGVTVGFIGLSVLTIPDTLSFEPEPDSESEEEGTSTTPSKAAGQSTASQVTGAAAKKAIGKSSSLRPIRSPLRPARTRAAAQAPESATEDGAE
jgi:hypothetical protein